LNFQGCSLIFHGVSFSSRHCRKCSGGQLLSRFSSLGVASMTARLAGRRHYWRVASEIRSTKSDFLSAMTDS
jgi:hypothetical protein